MTDEKGHYLGQETPAPFRSDVAFLTSPDCNSYTREYFFLNGLLWLFHLKFKNKNQPFKGVFILQNFMLGQ